MKFNFKTIIIALLIFNNVVFIGFIGLVAIKYYDHEKLEEQTEVINNSIEKYEIEKTEVYYVIREYIKVHSQIDDEEYLDVVTNSFVNLLATVEDNQHTVLYYIAICSVESNFKMESKSSAGAIGISQIMYSVWGETLKNKYGFTKDDLINQPHINVFAGYMIWRDYWERENRSIKKANSRYLGANSKIYTSKINERYTQLSNLMFKHMFKNS